MEKTQIELGIQQTMLAREKTEQAEKAQLPAQDQPVFDQPVQEEQEPPELQPTYTPYPTYTNLPQTTAPPAETPIPSEVDIQDRIRSANILVYEDIKGYFDLNPWVSRAINGMDFRGGKIVEVGDAVGDFMTHLNSPTDWDLIIVAAEIRTGVRGEFWDVILDQVNNDVALIAELWYLDEIASGRISPLLGKCGIQFQKDWWREEDDSVLDFSLYWLDQSHEVFDIYNSVGPLYTPNLYWENDAGDLIRLGAGGDAQLLAGRFPNEKSTYGVLASCLDGRVIFQTFSSHDYKESQVIPLWQNYIIYTLTNHFNTGQ